VSNAETGWGIAGDSFRTMGALDRFGSPTWFRLGDLDFATHLYRTERLFAGATLSSVTKEIAEAFGLEVRILPMSDDSVRTRITLTSGAEVDFQEYFVRLRHEQAVVSVRYDGAEWASAAPGVLTALESAAAIVIAPSNPILSIGPILSVRDVKKTLERRRESVVAITPIIAGRALKGPADHLLSELGHEPSAKGVARIIAPVAGSFVVDTADADLAGEIEIEGVHAVIADTVMRSREVAASLAKIAIETVSR
ncbi:MAG TPA: 2-phospho-L-lactate transferase CofD family protein, partial [Acidimicrobiales bacterium]|nr:2-phospho-L-lactate transferase CofD family protein [Acidimicrobiales bacterium]